MPGTSGSRLPNASTSAKATSANRRLSVFKRYFRWALRERVLSADPTLRLQAARQPPPLIFG